MKESEQNMIFFCGSDLGANALRRALCETMQKREEQRQSAKIACGTKVYLTCSVDELAACLQTPGSPVSAFRNEARGLLYDGWGFVLDTELDKNGTRLYHVDVGEDERWTIIPEQYLSIEPIRNRNHEIR